MNCITRTRFAPSPTGKMHLGNLRTALYEYLIAKSEGGVFVLRIEDTDRSRYVDGAEDAIYNALKSAGIGHDEGPDVGGEYGPYVQSERQGSYIEYARELIAKGEAYYCFCSKERLESLSRNANTDAVRYDRHCHGLSTEETAAKLSAGEPYVIRQLIPDGDASFIDEVFGEITVSVDEMDDQVLIKSDGYPTYNFANVVDDHLMRITHVVRGSEYLTSTPKYNRLYDAFGWERPKYIHLPLVLNERGEKLSKRRGDASFEDLIEEGFLPQAIVNYVALLGWAPRDNTEIFTLYELIDAFDIKGLSKSPSKFDKTKLLWVNAQHLQRLSKEEFTDLAAPYIIEAVGAAADVGKLAPMAQTRVSLPKDCKELFAFIKDVPNYNMELYTNKKMKTDKDIALSVIKATAKVFDETNDWSNEALYNAMINTARALGYKNSQVLWPVRVALSGLANTPCGGSEIAEIIGRAATRARLIAALTFLSQPTPAVK